MKYYIISSAFEGHGRSIETEAPIEELVNNSKNGLIPLKDGKFIGIDLLKNSLISPINEKEKSTGENTGLFGFYFNVVALKNSLQDAQSVTVNF